MQRKHSPNLRKWAQEAPEQGRISFVAGSMSVTIMPGKYQFLFPGKKKDSQGSDFNKGKFPEYFKAP